MLCRRFTGLGMVEFAFALGACFMAETVISEFSWAADFPQKGKTIQILVMP